ncbi:DUF6783 domain-containing protein [Fusicatenibacter saccharivorans]
MIRQPSGQTCTDGCFYVALPVHSENRYDALIRAKSPVNCDTHFAGNLF